MFRELPIARQAEYLTKANRPQLAAILSLGHERWPNVPDELWDKAMDRHAVLVHIERTGMAANFAKQATPDDPAPVGPDMGAAEAAALTAINQARAEMAEIGQAEETLRRTIAAVAIAASLPVAGAHTLLMGAAA